MSVIRDVLRARRAHQSLATGLRRVRQAQGLLDASHLRVSRARERVIDRRGTDSLGDVTEPTEEDLELIAAVDDWLWVRKQIQGPVDDARRLIDEHAESLRLVRSRRALVGACLTRSARSLLPEHLMLAETALAALSGVCESRLMRTTLHAIARRRSDPYESLARYRRNNAYFVAAIEHLRDQVSATNRRDPVSGGLPAEVASRVESTPLIPGSFTSILRRYQAFGARYVIAQKRVILGDEMGLGKTVQALAAMCHLHAIGARNMLVVAPNSVVVNWERETGAHTSLRSVVLHGPRKDERVRSWIDSGAIGITTFGTCAKIAHLIDHLDVLVVDEAHHVKNPQTSRTAAVASVAAKTDHVVLMTGTALENRLAELGSLALLAQPEMRDRLENVVAERGPDPGVIATMLSPVYLRRTQSDVLKELPERIHVDEWIDLSDEDRSAYLETPPTLVEKRLAAITGCGTGTSAKYERLVDLVVDHREAGHKIVVFSFFRRVIADAARLVGTDLIITGDSSPTERQRVIDRFSVAPPGSVLVCQIDAGGVGVNLQMAQVVIICEPQLKPSTEWQATARVHRMGQSRPVMVHRLLARDTVDERLVDLVARKEQEFFVYAHDSAVKHESRMAVDTHESTVATQLQRLLDEGEIA